MSKNKGTSSEDYWMFKAPPLLKIKLDRIREERIKRGKNRVTDLKSKLTYRRIGLAIARHDQFIESIINADFIDDKKGQFSVFNIYTFVVVAFLAVVMFGGLIYVSGILNTTFQQVGISNEVNAGRAGYVNMTQAATNTFGQMNNSIQALRLVALTLIFSLILGTVVINSLMKVHPAFFFVYVLIVGLGVIFSAPVSNAYNSLLESNVYDGLLQSFTGSNWILLNLPLVVAVMGILGGIFLFINIINIGGQVGVQ
jgi:hypothetical protein